VAMVQVTRFPSPAARAFAPAHLAGSDLDAMLNIIDAGGVGLNLDGRIETQSLPAATSSHCPTLLGGAFS
jgi:hypothetical protein